MGSIAPGSVDGQDAKKVVLVQWRDGHESIASEREREDGVGRGLKVVPDMGEEGQYTRRSLSALWVQVAQLGDPVFVVTPSSFLAVR